jgi:ribosomal protein S18 acetylase RimI-like enzyme
VNLVAPIGTPLCMIQILDYEKSQKCIEEIAKKSLNMGKNHSVKYIFIPSLPENQTEITQTFKKQGFTEKARWYRMERSLEDTTSPPEILKFEKVEKNKVREFLESASHCTSGSYEGETIVNLAGVPDTLLSFWYEMQELYSVYKDTEMVGILNLTPSSQSNLNNIGVAPEFRSKGLGKQILLFALERLKDLGMKRVGLRVHAKNTRAMNFYKSFGFNIVQEVVDLIHWEKDLY